MVRQERAERSRASILDAAAAEFDDHGYSGARLERIVERAGLTKGAVYFHFRSKLDLAQALVAEKYANWPGIIAEIESSGLRGLAAAEELTKRVGAVFATDAHVRAAMKLSQTVLPPAPENDPYGRWEAVLTPYLEQAAADGQFRAGVHPQEVARVAVEAFFGAYMIADERGRLDGLADDVERLWRVLGAA